MDAGRAHEDRVNQSDGGSLLIDESILRAILQTVRAKEVKPGRAEMTSLPRSRQAIVERGDQPWPSNLRILKQQS